MANIITIPKPCHENWNEMTPKDQGRHCGSCAKTVVDFTTWQSQDIVQHFNRHKNVCGRFTVDQLNEPIPSEEDFVKQIAYFKVSTIKKVAAIFLFAFMIGTSSCNENDNPLQSLISVANISTIDTVPKKTFIGDTIVMQPKDIIAGGVEMQVINDTPRRTMGKPAIRRIPLPKTVTPVNNRPMIMGEPAMIDTTAPSKPNCTTNENFVVGKMSMEVIKTPK
jgi:hypothetical protein